MALSTRAGSGDFDLTMDELRVVTRYVVQHAEDVLPVFEQAAPDDRRPHAAVDAAWTFMSALDHSLRQAADRPPGDIALSRTDARGTECSP
jgi:hypothetical protein